MFQNPTIEDLRKILTVSKTIAVVGLSDKPNRESYAVSQQMKNRGYLIVPVNPNASTVLGEIAYPSIRDIPFPIDIINIFRNSAALVPVVEEAILTSAPVIWAQQGVYDEAAADLAQKHNKVIVMDSCIAVMQSLLVRH